MKERVLTVLESALPNVDFIHNNHLTDDGLLDSLAIVTIISEVSSEFDIEIPFEDLDSSNFNSVDSITKLVEKCIKNKR